MKIRQILNNNVALVERGKLDVIVLSKGISFHKKVGDTISLDEVEKVFVPDSNDVLENYSYLLSNASQSTLDATLKVIEYAESKIDEKVNDYLYLTLLDHIDYALKRAAKSQFVVSPLAWEVRKFYPHHYEMGKHTLEIITKETGVEFPESEAVAIALHFINLQESQVDIKDAIEAMEIVSDILTIIRIHFQMQFDEGSMNYNRLVTHLQYFAQRITLGEIYNSEDTELNKQVRIMYPQAYLCVNKIRVYLLNRFTKELTQDEETYLMLHIHRVTQRNESEE
ncbi:beta-glucoside operon transcriptional antiterminator [Breznakia sp. PF5-3]|uniref:PRD domain-containing protein n=1 Tax=unclassified Breznakia TaxID=2623764 RepID=UPI002406CF96|nr:MULTISPECIES: PRD domain-containing protein [unclassified Breznakia]MDF9825071.1 beta-glucoside operon transcriptional antiterminator [Breznakia sp. PM6-1]MDF9835918.1 beta-glucoside operon transcriptional antiterminator [Breznakia sp. PF5-3]MDF9837379.1 beta-glucoside operon transcriptional antiterminator [Breznakia sp. PFB2-8]MDF9859314.1 beta-glucoside operon transcriptional antiterminator [Breznakia sp. PH5-24]